MTTVTALSLSVCTRHFYCLVPAVTANNANSSFRPEETSSTVAQASLYPGHEKAWGGIDRHQ